MFTLYSIYDAIFFPLFVIIIVVVLSSYSKASKLTAFKKKHLFYAFLFRIIFCLLYFLILQFYYSGYGDTTGYWQCIGSLREMDWSVKSGFLFSPNATVKYGSTLFYFFGDYNGFVMANPSNAAVAKIGYFFSLICANSYITLSLFYSFIAFLGCWKLFLLFTRYYPSLEREFALALLYLPSVCFWSSGLLKDPLALGAMGLFISSIHSLVIDKKKIISSIFTVFVTVFVILIIKPYILLAVIPGLAIWIFSKFNFTALNKQMRSLITFIFIIIASGVVALLLNYFTSTEYARQLATENISDKITEMRSVYSANDLAKGNSYFELGTTNPFLAFFMGIIASLFRPFLWETKSFNMFFSGAEAFMFLLITLYIFFKFGIINTFRSIFSNSETIFFFLFTMVFAGAVGSSTANFGTLVRYKIPCLPFYLMMLFILMYRNKIPYPAWLNKLLGKQQKRKQQNGKQQVSNRTILHA